MIFIKSIYSITISILSIVLASLIIFISVSTLFTVKQFIPRNSINVSPITGEVIKSVMAPKEFVEFTYTLTPDTNKIDDLSNADIIYEYINANGDALCKTIFHDNMPLNAYSKENAISIPKSHLPSFNFIDFIDIPKNYSSSANSINVKLNNNIISRFSLEDGYYTHYRNSIKDLNPATSKPVEISNVIVQFCSDSNYTSPLDLQGKGLGLLFIGGKVIDIRWEREKSKPIKVVDEQGNPVSLLRGRTWWIIVKDNSYITYN